MDNRLEWWPKMAKLALTKSAINSAHVLLYVIKPTIRVDEV